eukprot:3716217-Pyramimonas_sp.AAC.1
MPPSKLRNFRSIQFLLTHSEPRRGGVGGRHGRRPWPVKLAPQQHCNGGENPCLAPARAPESTRPHVTITNKII